jgi:hypothetical protein
MCLKHEVAGSLLCVGGGRLLPTKKEIAIMDDLNEQPASINTESWTVS